jgi:hypothetical protein
MATKKVNKLGDKLTKCSDSLTVNIYDNGFMVEISGRDSNDDWKSAKIMWTAKNVRSFMLGMIMFI